MQTSLWLLKPETTIQNLGKTTIFVGDFSWPEFFPIAWVKPYPTADMVNNDSGKSFLLTIDCWAVRKKNHRFVFVKIHAASPWIRVGDFELHQFLVQLAHGSSSTEIRRHFNWWFSEEKVPTAPILLQLEQLEPLGLLGPQQSLRQTARGMCGSPVWVILSKTQWTSMKCVFYFKTNLFDVWVDNFKLVWFCLDWRNTDWDVPKNGNCPESSGQVFHPWTLPSELIVAKTTHKHKIPNCRDHHLAKNIWKHIWLTFWQLPGIWSRFVGYSPHPHPLPVVVDVVGV